MLIGAAPGQLTELIDSSEHRDHAHRRPKTAA
jgi:hypothetical protein